MLKTTCKICGLRRKYKTLAYDNELNAYCASPFMCSSNHPNSQNNCASRGTYLNLLPYDEAQKLMVQYYEQTYESAARSKNKRVRDVSMQSLVTGTISFRLTGEEQAEYLAYTLAKIGSNKITDAIQAILQEAIENDYDFKNKLNIHFRGEELKQTQEAPAPQPKPKQEETQDDDEDVFTL